MSIQAAHDFIRLLREDPGFREELRATLEGNRDLDALCRHGAERGLVFTVPELRQAFKHDWGLRWLAARLAATPPPDLPPDG